MSPLAAVAIYGSAFVGESPITLIRRHLPALLASAGSASQWYLSWGRPQTRLGPPIRTRHRTISVMRSFCQVESSKIG